MVIRSHNAKLKLLFGENFELHIDDFWIIKNSEISVLLCGENSPTFGRKATDAERKHMSEINQGDKNPFYGKTFDKSTKRKIADGSLKRIGENHPKFGKPCVHSDETKNLIAQKKKEYNLKYSGEISRISKIFDTRTEISYSSKSEARRLLNIPNFQVNRLIEDGILLKIEQLKTEVKIPRVNEGNYLSGINSPVAKPIRHIETGICYGSISEASGILNISRKQMSNKIKNLEFEKITREEYCSIFNQNKTLEK